MRRSILLAALFALACGVAQAGPSTVLQVAPNTCKPTPRSITTVANTAVTLVPANAARSTVLISIPPSLTTRLYVSVTGTAGPGINDSEFYAAGTTLEFDTSVWGAGAISIYTATGGIYLAAHEC